MRRAFWLWGAILLVGCSNAPAPSPTPPLATTPSASASVPPSPRFEDRTDSVKKAVGQLQPGVAVGFQQLGSEKRLLLGEQRSYEAASLVKLPILVELYRRAEAGQLSLDEEMTFEERFRVGGSGEIGQGPAGTRWTLAELGRLMIVKSDNVASDMLLERLGMDLIQRSMGELGLQDTTVQRTIFDFEAIDAGRDNLTSTRDMVRLLALIADQELPGSKAMRTVLEQQTKNELIPAGLPPLTRVAHKTGELTGLLHDAGIVSTPQGDYILVLLGEFPDRQTGVATWKALSARVYGAFTR